MLQLISALSNNLPAVLPGTVGATITALQILTAAVSFSNEANPQTRAKYSKFAVEDKNAKKMIGSRDGMTLIYLPAFLTCCALYFLPKISNISIFPEQNIAEIFLIIHFGKRLLEVLFLHKYSGKVERDLSIGIGIYYALGSLLISCVALPDFNINSDIIIAGAGLFATGICGNFYHHYLLAKLRDSKAVGSYKYVVPKGGLFEYVAAPHYLFELIGWLGIAVVSQHLNAYLVFLCMTSYLSGRAYAQNEWNKKKFSSSEWDESKKNIIPFIY